ncbi:Histone deacetylase HOS3 [Mycena sanguinolenta]|uniref:Histone deacetylase HOS3 n=1 Tax=Mycena sanguinolenta TaxID=230812 RepID=A0A8H6XX09_9AGAR|nr:Histone deacetylase HOS3 [Mycena sanguinolenta]
MPPTTSGIPVAKPAIYLQDACFGHRYIRSRDLSAIVERPERLRAVAIGLSAAISRLEAARSQTPSPDDLVAQLARLNIESKLSESSVDSPVSIVRSSATADILKHPAVKYIHGDIDGDVYLENLVRWIRESKEKVDKGESEIPAGLSQGDLYLCPESISAIQGAIGTICEAVDAVLGPNQTELVNRAFVIIRPPGHHCGEDTPSGFCFLNNVAVGAAHGNDKFLEFNGGLIIQQLTYNMESIVSSSLILTCTMARNGTQSIAWQINEETYRQTLESEAGAPVSQTGPQVYYGSIHDILSYPCEDGKAELVQAASVSIHGSHGQYIENVHLQTYTSVEHWDKLYAEQYSKILRKAEEFLDSTGGPGKDVLFFISCGMDASEHEMPSMSRHNRRVPTSFFYQFARDACALSDRYAGGKICSVLEGGYSDRALISGSMAHLLGLADSSVGADWWSAENLTLLEKATKSKRGGRPSLPQVNVNPWLNRALAIFSSIDGSPPPTSTPRAPPPPSSMTLRDRKKPNSTVSSPRGKTAASATEASAESSSSEDSPQVVSGKKIPRVILRLGPAPDS